MTKKRLARLLETAFQEGWECNIDRHYVYDDKKEELNKIDWETSETKVLADALNKLEWALICDF